MYQAGSGVERAEQCSRREARFQSEWKTIKKATIARRLPPSLSLQCILCRRRSIIPGQHGKLQFSPGRITLRARPGGALKISPF